MSRANPTILFCSENSTLDGDARAFLEEAGFGVAQKNFREARSSEASEHFQMIILEGTQREAEGLQLCRHFRSRPGDTYVPLLFITNDHTPAARLASFEAGADTFLLSPFARGELLAQVRAFLRMKEVNDRLTEKTAEVHQINKRLQKAYEQIDQELELARHIQQSLLPQSLPELPGTRFAVNYLPCGRVGGDFYDIFRLDEKHVGFYIADAMGHGVPASLLTMYLKKAVRGKEITGNKYRLLPPHEVLLHLNRDLLEQGLADTPFITMVYALFNYHDNTLQYARAGHPYPVLLSAKGPPETLKIDGSLLGVFETEYKTHTRKLEIWDKVLFYTDGIDGLTYEDYAAGTQSLLACLARIQGLHIADLVKRLGGDLFPQNDRPDDLTVFGLEVTSD